MCIHVSESHVFVCNQPAYRSSSRSRRASFSRSKAVIFWFLILTSCRMRKKLSYHKEHADRSSMNLWLGWTSVPVSVWRCATGGRYLPTRAGVKRRSCGRCWAQSSQSPGSRLPSGLETWAGMTVPAQIQTSSNLKAFVVSMISFFLLLILDDLTLRKAFM